MNINIHGHYKFKNKNKIILEGDNLITFYGEIFLLNRCINDDFKPLQYLVLGNGKNIPLKTDRQLGNETCRHECYKQADINTNSIVLTNSFTGEEIRGITEIGVATDDFLISHDVFEKIDNSIISNLLGTIEVEYTFTFKTTTTRKDWTLADGYTKTYFVYEPSFVSGVFEDGKHGYISLNSKNDVEQNPASYYYNSFTNNLYIHPKRRSDGVELDPNLLNISIQTSYNNETLDLK